MKLTTTTTTTKTTTTTNCTNVITERLNFVNVEKNNF
jgi:hypothetical protein